MSKTHVREWPGRSDETGGPSLDLVVSKLLPPVVRPGTIRRPSLTERLANGEPHQIVSVVAPAGYGKTTLLAQWAERSGRAVAWVSVDEQDNDPKVLLGYVAQALDAVQPVGQLVFDALASPASSVPGSVVPRLGAAFASMTVPILLILDDVHLLRNSECRAALSVLAGHVPACGRLVLAGRDQPPVRVARLRAEGRIAEVGPADLALTREEAAMLLRDAQVQVTVDDLTSLHQRTEGWAAGLYLAALSVREGGSLPGAVASFGGDDQFVSQYVESELLARISRRQREFLTRAAVLDRISSPLCEAALDLPGSAAALAELAGSNMLLVPLDRRGEWYRYHHLFRDMLRAELERREPGLAPAVQRRAAAWYERSGLPEDALEYSMAAGDVDQAARLVERLWLPAYWAGRRGTLERWVRWLDQRDGIRQHPMIAVMAGFLFTVTGRPVEAERWAGLIDHWQYEDPGWAGDPATEAFAATLRAVHCRHGVEQMRADLDEAARKYAVAGIVTPTPAFYRGKTCILAGEPGRADAFFQDAVSVARQTDAHEVLVPALYERSRLAMARGDWSQAEDLASQARAACRGANGVEESAVWVAEARVAAHRGDIPAARQALARAQGFRPLLTYAMPHNSVQLRIELIRAHLALADLAGARTLMRETDEILRRRPHLGTLVGEAEELRTRLAAEGGSPVAASSLTAAELRLLPLLSTHMSVPEIAAEMYLSPHTIRTQARSIYRKLDAASRSQAIARARELGLLEG